MFGLRMSEVLGLHKANVDFENNLLHIKGSIVDGKFLNKTKNRGSTRPLEIDKNAIQLFDWWLGYLKQHSNYQKHRVYVFPGVHRFDLEVKQSRSEDNQLCYKTARNIVWKALARMGLAEISIAEGGHVIVHNSDFKGNPFRQFRHRF